MSLENRPSVSPRPLDRRALLQGLGGLSAAALAGGALSSRMLAANGRARPIVVRVAHEEHEEHDDDAVTPPRPEDRGLRNPFAHLRGERPVSDAELATARQFLLQSTFCRRNSTSLEGNYVANPPVRSNLVEDRAGLPVTLFFMIVREADCSPVQGAEVDVWHADAAGVYSGLAGHGTLGRTFLRGIQVTDGSGIVRFDTIFPGWYSTRTTHIHLKIRPTPTTQIVTQIYFDQLFGFSGSLGEAIYRWLPPYNAIGPALVDNAHDYYFTPDTVLASILNPNGTASIWSGLRFAIA